MDCGSRATCGCASAWLEFFYEALDPEIKQSIDRAVSIFVRLGAEIREVDVPMSSGRTVIQAEAYASFDKYRN